MRAINHALTGSLIGLTVGRPLIAIPTALASHYICDIIPHYSSGLDKTTDIRSKSAHYLLYLDAVLCVSLIVILAIRQPVHWELSVVSAFVAAAPDFATFNQFFQINKRHRKWNPGAYVNFAAKIQWFERPVGAIVEVAWFVGATILLIPFLD